MVEGTINGFNSTVFAYGATGAGKTFTMLGNEHNPGVMMLTFYELFQKVKEMENDKQFQIKLSYLEIYNEVIRDLLSAEFESLELREDPNQGMIVFGLSEVIASSVNEVMRLLLFGNQRRTQKPTKANQHSSRSHAILQVTIESRNKDRGVNSDVKKGKLSMIDLAGSERASKTENTGII